MFHEDFFIPVPEFIHLKLERLHKNHSKSMKAYSETHTNKLTELCKEMNLAWVSPPTTVGEFIDNLELQVKFENKSVKNPPYLCRRQYRGSN